MKFKAERNNSQGLNSTTGSLTKGPLKDNIFELKLDQNIPHCMSTEKKTNGNKNWLRNLFVYLYLFRVLFEQPELGCIVSSDRANLRGGLFIPVTDSWVLRMTADSSL